jgi:hypothetical protein
MWKFARERKKRESSIFKEPIMNGLSARISKSLEYITNRTCSHDSLWQLSISPNVRRGRTEAVQASITTTYGGMAEYIGERSGHKSYGGSRRQPGRIAGGGRHVFTVSP